MAGERVVCSYVKIAKAKDRVICPGCSAEYLRSESDENSDWVKTKEGRKPEEIEGVKHLGHA